MTDKRFFLVLALWIFIIPMVLSFNLLGNSIDMKDSVLKLNEPVFFFPYNMKGFSVFDAGEKQLKFFDWKFKPVKKITITIGEGPAEIKQSILSMCTIKERIFLIGLMERTVKEFNSDGSFVKSLPLDFIPKNMVCHNDKLYVFNTGFTVKKDAPLLCKVITPETDYAMDDITLKDDLQLKKIFSGNPLLLGLSSTFDMGKGKIYILTSSANALFEISMQGKLIRRIDLPYKERIIFRTEKNGDEEQKVMSVMDWYPCLKVLKSGVYACFLKHIGKDGQGSDKYETYVLKISAAEKKSAKKLDGNYVIIGEHKDNLFLFETQEYTAVSVKLNEWR